jgi:general stress protein 26
MRLWSIMSAAPPRRLLAPQAAIRPRLRKVAMDTPRASRPYMPGYGTLGPDQGSGLLPWSWAEQRLLASRNYWVASRWPDGHPHAMPVWGVWHDGAFWFSSSRGSRKVRNLAADPRCVVTTENAVEPVVVEGLAEVVTDPGALATMLALENAKYHTNYGIELLDPAVNATIQVRPRWAFGLAEDDFTGSPTRWSFNPE